VEIIDISIPIRPGMVTYPGDPVVTLERVRSIAADGYNLSRLDFGVHSGTHVDAPVHFVDEAAAAESLPLDVLIGPCVVVEGIQIPDGVERVLFKTSNSELWARDTAAEEFESLDAGTAQALVDKGVLLVGIDYLSIGDEDVHRVLLGAGIVAVEGLDLRGVAAGDYELICAPLKLVGSDGAPARVFLRRARALA
jgi:arylformamidase